MRFGKGDEAGRVIGDWKESGREVGSCDVVEFVPFRSTLKKIDGTGGKGPLEDDTGGSTVETGSTDIGPGVPEAVIE